MKFFCKLIALTLLITLASLSKGISQCETAPLEGYRGNCEITAVVSKDGKYVYSSNGDAIKKWNFASKTIEAEWPTPNKVLELVGVSGNNGRYVQYRNSDRSINLFDTEKGEKVIIEGNEVLAIFENLNIAVLSELKSRTAQMIKSYYTKALSYDLKTGKQKSMAEYRWFAAAESAGRIALGEGDDVKIYDVISGKLLYTVTINSFEKAFGLSNDGKYLAWYEGIVDLDTKKVTPIKTTYDNSGAIYAFSPDSKAMYFMQKAQFHNFDWHYGFAKVEKYDVATGQKLNDFSADWTSSIQKMGQAYKVLPASGNQFYIFDGKTVALTSEQSFQSRADVLDLFGNIGSGGKAQIAKEEEEKARIASLKEKMAPKFEALQETEYFYFPNGNHLHLHDYNSETGLALIGDVFQSGLFKMPEGTLINGFAPDPVRMRIGPNPKQVKTGIHTVSGAISPDGKIVAFGGDGAAELYRNGVLVKRYTDVVFNKILDDRLAIASVIGEKKIVLYDFQENKIVFSYGKGEGTPELSADKTKLLRDSKVYDVKSGNVLFESKENLRGITNSYAIPFSGGKLRLIDIRTGKDVEPLNWNEKKLGRESFISGNYLVTFTSNGPMYVYDLENRKYVSEQPVVKLSDNVFEERAYFSATNDVFILNNQGFASYRSKDDQPEYATSYCMNAVSGEIFPHLFHQPRQIVQAANKKQEEANRPSPDVTDLLNTLRDLPAGYKFDYSNFDYLNLTNNAVATRYFTYLGADKIYGLGKVCSGFGRTKVLVLIQKKPGSNEQLIFHLLEVGPKGILKNDILGYTQKVNGAVTELANLEIISNGSSRNIKVTTGARVQTFSCN